MARMRVAVVDIGTNSTRLLVADVADGRVSEVERRSTVTRLGRGVDTSRQLAAEAVEDVCYTVGEYMHLAASGIEVRPGQHVERGDELGLSGNTGFSSTPHLHFQVMTAGDDGISKQSFPFDLAVRPHRSSPPVQGQRYAAWE